MGNWQSSILIYHYFVSYVTEVNSCSLDVKGFERWNVLFPIPYFGNLATVILVHALNLASFIDEYFIMFGGVRSLSDSSGVSLKVGFNSQ
ncbi:hypothetical protein NIES4106_44620 [Fischerella sp. NIES-4106]|nr:hypothetical protein NIES4106_44620 [Fischerella sp. NIES-4106]